MRLFTLVGPTGIGKTAIGVELARKFDLEIISVDSRQIYKDLDIGTAKPPKEIQAEIKFHMIDIVNIDELYSAGEFARDCRKLIYMLKDNKREFILVGGSGLYFKALFEPFFDAPPRNNILRKKLSQEPISVLYEKLKKIDPIWAIRISPNDRQRIIRALEIYEQTKKPISYHTRHKTVSEFIPYYVGITMDRNRLYQQIDARFEEMVKKGLIKEVQEILRKGYSEELNALKSIGYKEIIGYLKGRLSLEDAIRLAKRNSRMYAKRQLTWFKKIPGIRWIEYTNFEETTSLVLHEYEKYLEEREKNS
ncbi:MAG: tRNA (adenosine(37)-N6)-dimethylallyltransferase MiaA [candidate division WOR-3 bacterium]|nr:tRNA (adenosine(37)-N6)-dimethylallyltransferase MiaA [candidate division WOR-3 bacterium]MDW7987530.1 tRNA (adenosine(37)-N6)-dimethylallyltransferase MiaA [candidate division WOR-3 bacterium]